MKGKLVCLLLCMLALAGCGSGGEDRLAAVLEKGKLVVGLSPDFAPLEFRDLSADGMVYAGSDVALAQYIAEALGVELELRAMDFHAVTTAVTTGAVDLGISGLSWTRERAQGMELSHLYNVPDHRSQGILVRADEAAAYNTASDFSGKIIAVQSGAVQEALVEAQLPHDARRQPVSSLGEAVIMLEAGKVDAVAVDYDNGRMFSLNNPGLSLCGFWFQADNQGYTIGAQKGQTALIGRVNEILAQVNRQGLYPQWKDEAIALAHSLGLDHDG